MRSPNSSQNKSLVYMPYLTLGDPSWEKTVEFGLAMMDVGADLLEIGIPFSDPTADGRVIQASMDRALAKGFRLEDVFLVCQKLHKQHPKIPLVLLSYLNPIVNGFAFIQPDPKIGGYISAIEARLRVFLEKCQASGVHALVIPDLPFDQVESEVLRKIGPEYGVSQILMIAPNTSQDRLSKISETAQGWIYYVTSLGVTGTRKKLPTHLAEGIERVRQSTNLPLLAGFGFHSPEQIESVRELLDGIIVGSMNQKLIQENGNDALPALKKLTSAFVQACSA